MGDLSELMASIVEKGVIEPLVVRQRGGRFQIVAGSDATRRRCRSGIRELPVVIRDLDDTEVIEVALVENLQRKDLTPFEGRSAGGARREMSLHARGSGAQAGKSRTSITESMALRHARGRQEPLSAGRHFL